MKNFLSFPRWGECPPAGWDRPCSLNGGPRKVDIWLHGKGNSRSHGARPVHLIINVGSAGLLGVLRPHHAHHPRLLLRARTTPKPETLDYAPGMVLLQGPREALFLISQVPLYAACVMPAPLRDAHHPYLLLRARTLPTPNPQPPPPPPSHTLDPRPSTLTEWRAGGAVFDVSVEQEKLGET